MLAHTSSGGACVNHSWMHMGVPGLPFGGVGESGMGDYHGEHSFRCFTHRKAVFRSPTAVDLPLIYPPFTAAKDRWIRRLL